MSERLARSAGLIGLATLASRVLGLVRDQAQGIFFGTGAAADAFVVATRLPNLLRDLFAEGAMSAAFVPTFTRYLTNHGREAAWRLGSQVVNALLVVTGAATLVGILGAGPLVAMYASGYADSPDKLALTTSLARVTMPFLPLIAIAVAFMGMLNALRRFLIPAVSPATFNVMCVVCTVTLVPVFRNVGVEPAMALALGLLLGGVAQVVIQWPSLRTEGYRHQWTLDWRDPGLREILILMGPGTLGVAAAQINTFVNTYFATSEDGAASALRYAFQLMYVPIGIFGVSVATAALPDLARQAAQGAFDGMRSTVSSGLRLMLMLCVPAVVGLMVLAEPIVQLLYEYGQFNRTSTLLVASSLLFYAPGVLGYSAVKIISPSFYSLRDTRTPVLVSLGTILLNVILSMWLNSVMGFRGLALSTAIASNANACLLLLLLSRRLGGVDEPRLGRAFVKIVVASAIMGVAAYYAHIWLRGLWPDPTVLARIVGVGGAIAFAVGALALSAHLLRIDEFRLAVRRVLARVRR
jgi:putative peptidoglycan lipid II flippase